MARKAKVSSRTGSKPSIPGPSANPMTNLIVVDLVLKAGTRVVRHALERGVLGTKYSPDKARAIVKSRSMTQTLVGTAVARIATGSVPGALVVGGALLAKSLYDMRKGRQAAEIEGQAAIEEKVEEGKEASGA
ncbi:MAG: hypothetical protein ABWZ75_04300 [Novosphingobium sp.]